MSWLRSQVLRKKPTVWWILAQLEDFQEVWWIISALISSVFDANRRQRGLSSQRYWISAEHTPLMCPSHSSAVKLDYHPCTLLWEHEVEVPLIKNAVRVGFSKYSTPTEIQTLPTSFKENRFRPELNTFENPNLKQKNCMWSSLPKVKRCR